ncbi:MAG TPA: tetratricopeptide repeat protein [Pyrinomonadaceae bacterium]|nr:tetratricopeptide repeat protein [Pyrinomonadaceae bacterium]
MLIANRKNSPLEQRQRLSRSMIWQLQRNFFDRQGIEAWRADGVPYHITSNPFIADAYARIVFGFLRDCQRAPAGLDSEQPLYIVELGSGHGRFGFLFLKRFLRLLSNSAFHDQPIKYLMTDFTRRNIDYWRTHEWLKPFIEKGVLDFALFDAEKDQELRLEISGEVLSASTLRNPLTVIANYVFDSIPQDAFSLQDGQLFENLVTVVSGRKEPVLDDPELLSRIEVLYHHNPANSDYYGDSEWDQILEDSRQRLPGTEFLFPIAALQCIRNLDRLAQGRLLLLSADKGYNRDEALLWGQGFPGIVMHASFSMMVDYQIIGKYFIRHGGQALHPTHQHENLNISAFWLNDSGSGVCETRQAYRETIEKFGPDDFFSLSQGLGAGGGVWGFEQLLAFLRLSCWDYVVFRDCLSGFKRHLPEISEAQHQKLFEAIKHVWDLHYPIGEEFDLAFQLGTLLLEMHLYPEALDLLNHSVAIYGMEPGTAYNMAICHYHLRQMSEARNHINQALEMDPDFDAAKALRIKLESPQTVESATPGSRGSLQQL